MNPVPQSNVVRDWLMQEYEKSGTEKQVIREFETPERLVGELLSHKPNAGSILWKHSINWFSVELSEKEFRTLRVIEGSSDTAWQRATPDGTVVGVAKRIYQGESVPVDTERVLAMKREVDSIIDGGNLILFKSNGLRTPYVVDGNHRATAIALHLFETGEYKPTRAYLGLKTSSVFRSIVLRSLSLGRLLPTQVLGYIEKTRHGLRK